MTRGRHKKFPKELKLLDDLAIKRDNRISNKPK
jgi:hypothetical protein